MRISISNIAWDRAEDKGVAAVLAERGVDAIDIAPGKYFPDPAKATDAEIAATRKWWSERGVEIVGMQALLFGTVGLNIFGSAEVQDALLEHLAGVCRIADGLGARRLVFGSPRNRDRQGLSDGEALALAVPFFRRLGHIAHAHDVVICLEPNPPRYGANFMITSEETAQVVERVAHPSIRMQLDTGALAINGENPQTVLSRWAHLIGHIHASEPDLVVLGDGGTDHGAVAEALTTTLPDHVVTIEMVATQKEPHLQAIGRALDVAIHHYRKTEARGKAA